MRQAFPLAAVRDYRDLAPAMLHHPKDRHVPGFVEQLAAPTGP